MFEEAAARLEQLGIDTEGLEELIDAECLRACNYVKGICNIDLIPEVLKPVCIDLACAEIITAEGVLDTLDDEGRLSGIKEGDVTLEFRAGDREELKKRLLDRLDFNDKSLLISYRKLKW